MTIDRNTLAPVFGIALVTALVSLFPGRVVVLRGALGVSVADGLPVVAGLLFGPVGAWGTGIGYLGSALATGAVDLLTLFSAVGYVLSGYVAFTLWRWVDRWSAATRSPFRSGRQVAGLFVVVVVGSTVAAVVVGWGYEVVGAFPFYTASVLTLPERLLASGLLAVALVVVGPALPDDVTNPTRFGPVLEGSSPRAVVLVTAVWYVIGTVVSVGYQVYEVVPPMEFTRRGVGFLAVFGTDALFSYAGGRIQLVVGSVLCVALVVAIAGRAGRVPIPFGRTST